MIKIEGECYFWGQGTICDWEGLEGGTSQITSKFLFLNLGIVTRIFYLTSSLTAHFCIFGFITCIYDKKDFKIFSSQVTPSISNNIP